MRNALGFYQYQSVVPREVGLEATQEMLKMIKKSGEGSFLAVGTAEALASSRDYRVKQFMNGLPSEQYTVRAGEFS